MVVALAHAIVLKNLGRSYSGLRPHPLTVTEGKNTPHDKIAAKLEQGADIVKSVYRYA